LTNTSRRATISTNVLRQAEDSQKGGEKMLGKDRKINKLGGFTLIELLVVIAI